MAKIGYCRVRVGVWVLALGLLVAPAASAWGPQGHRIVARLAQAQLTPQALATAQRLLATRHVQYLSEVATWADELRDTDRALFQRTRRLHYVNFTSSDCIYRPPLMCRRGRCVVAGIDQYSAILADRHNSDAKRAQALAFVVHFVADVHEPLHAGYRHDAGGNDYWVRWRGRRTSLHRMWDSGLLSTTHLSAARYTSKLLRERTPVASGGNATDWAEESCRIDRDRGVYPAGHRIDDAYVARELPIAEQRLRQAGTRLAKLLNRDLASG